MAWAHGTNSLALFKDAMQSSAVASIECDVMMSSSPSDGDGEGGWTTAGGIPEPILSHPPRRDTDLTVAVMLSLLVATPNGGGGGVLRKHLKLDFKEMRAVQPTFDLIQRAGLRNPFQRTLTLNADILPGPGRRGEDPSIVPPSTFLETCLGFVERSRKVLSVVDRTVRLFALKSTFQASVQIPFDHCCYFVGI
jgi:Uncharacterized conserved protein (DUF2181)